MFIQYLTGTKVPQYSPLESIPYEVVVLLITAVVSDEQRK